MLVGRNSQYKEIASKFADWLVSARGGQKVVEEFEVGGEKLYSKAPTAQRQQNSGPLTPPSTPGRPREK